MRACQSCATPIPTAAKVCEHCGASQESTVGVTSAVEVPDTRHVAEENRKRDQEVGRFALMVLIAGSTLIAFVTGISMSNMLLGGATFFVALIILFITLQALGIDVGM